MAIVETAARSSAARKPTRRAIKRCALQEAVQLEADVVARIRDLAWIGQHGDAIALCTQALGDDGGKTLPIAVQIGLARSARRILYRAGTTQARRARRRCHACGRET